MTGLQTLLEDAVEHPTDVDVAGDLRRGHRALRRRRTRWAAGLTTGLVAAGAAGYAELPWHQHAVTVRPATDAPTTAPPMQTRYYRLPPPPDGWHVAGERPQYVMLGRDGTESRLDVFTGQLVVMLTDRHERFDNGPSVQYGGRTVYVNDRNDDTTILSVRTSPGSDWLQLQYPKGAFGTGEMVAYLCAVQVEPGAKPAVG